VIGENIGRYLLHDVPLLSRIAAHAITAGQHMQDASAKQCAEVPDLISVIVTTYNRVDALDAVLSALARQSDRRFEVIIADDGSSPATAALIARWQARLG